jgi:hypothetical protein
MHLNISRLKRKGERGKVRKSEIKVFPLRVGIANKILIISLNNGALELLK